MLNRYSRIFVTGGTGWLGSRFVDLLESGFAEHPELREGISLSRVTCLALSGDPATDSLRKRGVTVIEGDLRDSEVAGHFLKEGKEGVLFHLAGIIHPSRVREFFAINRDGTRRLLEAAAQNGVQRAVVMSSNSPFGCNPHEDHLFDEKSSYNPYMGYGRSKKEMELVVQDFQKSGRIETVLIRAPWFYGPNQPPRQSLFFTMIRTGKMPIIGGGTNRRSMSYVDNLSQGLVLAAERAHAAGQAYWIADERPYSMNEILDTIERLLEKDFALKVAHKRTRLPGIVSELAWCVDKAVQSLGLYHQKIHVLSEMNKNIACSVERARRELGYHPTVALEEGMRRSIRWCLDRGISL
jgi:nucleoside-diphosphate-sugar epimerase